MNVTGSWRRRSQNVIGRGYNEMLVENTIWGERNKVQIAIERLQQFEPPEGYYVAISGGKDSTVVYDLVKKARVKADFHYNVTYLDAPETVKYIKRHMPDVVFEYPSRTFWELVIIHRLPPIMTQRWCCRELKERGGEGRIVVTGVRWAESRKRKNRRMVESCYKKYKHFLHPIIDWDDEDVWEYIRANGLPYNPLYDRGHKRIGCRCCPFSSVQQRERDLNEYPALKKQFIRCFDKLVDKLKEEGKTIWQDGEDVLRWWIYGQKKIPEGQFSIFD
jgi:phosphoadenosine phosphosulfate reductase